MVGRDMDLDLAAHSVGFPHSAGQAQTREFTPPGLQKIPEEQIPESHSSRASSRHVGQSHLLSFTDLREMLHPKGVAGKGGLCWVSRAFYIKLRRDSLAKAIRQS